MGVIARLSHVGFNVPREKFAQECEFWEKVVGLKAMHGQAGRNQFFAADPLRDHEFILFATDNPVTAFGEEEYILNHIAFDVPSFAEIDELAARVEAQGTTVDRQPDGSRRRARFISPAGIRFELNTPPYANPEGYEDRPRRA
ncbi:MAG: hypothetical protein EXR58_07365 [Chloroflexi bacterium]|nr:hypothetical protein [Chloroflexota bacterium]